MFEKEAEKYLKKLLKRLKIKEEDLVENQPKFISLEKMNFISLNVSNVSKAFQDGAEFGYNKANEWHYPSKGEYPDNDNDILCQIDFETSEVGYFNEMYKNFFTIDGKEIKVKAWKEIVLPELKESE